ncbi:MAG: hypothetical protein HFG38_03370 [Eubacterium sp.]|jgi:Protein interacting with poly(A)-binding protein|nr:hypothetical protein [Eubacterium sp.]
MQHKIEQIFREVMQLDDDVELRGEMNSDELEEWDSLASMSLIMKLEKEFGIKYEFDDILQMDSLDAVKRITAGKVS